ncbi:hypothetical protein I7I51_05532 [Histoplasma capsulatum]|uniref:Uncharacterized protein n=1 Tax=Ajellomyces capsulatus TaxID=5037 RepID=A0A8A1M422_AJECA|nr:hypothetical protein I7I51_05532 [Histoplasma capsulatum]
MRIDKPLLAVFQFHRLRHRVRVRALAVYIEKVGDCCGVVPYQDIYPFLLLSTRNYYPGRAAGGRSVILVRASDVEDSSSMVGRYGRFVCLHEKNFCLIDV